MHIRTETVNLAMSGIYFNLRDFALYFPSFKGITMKKRSRNK